MTLLSTINANGNNYGIMGIAVPGSCATPAGTEVKVCTFTDNFELKAGGIFLIKFTYANTYGDGSTTYPKLQVNGTNYVMRRADGNYVESGEWDNNATLTFLFDGTDFILPAGSATGTASVPLGSILAIYSNSVPDGYLPCNGVQFDPAQFAGLYAFLGDDHTPDLRECALVGIGHNGTDVFDSTETDPSTGQAGTQNHDEYTLGEFKDDQVQTHTHNVVAVNSSQNKTVMLGSGSSGYGCAAAGGSAFVYEQGQNGRHGNTTRGKRKGVNYIIKATSGLPDNQQDYILNQLAPVDEVTIGNVHSVTSNAVAEKFGWKLVGEVSGGVSIPVNFNDYDEIMIIANVGYSNWGTVYACSQVFPSSYVKTHLGDYAWGFGGTLNGSTPYGYRARVTIGQNSILPFQSMYDDSDRLSSTLFSVYGR